MELWTVDVTAPDIETKSYMRNTLASESRRRTHINRCKSKGKPVNWPWWMQVPLQNKHAIPTIPDDPTYSPEGLSGSERKKWMDRRPTSLKTAEWAPPLLGSDPTVKLLGGWGLLPRGMRGGEGTGGLRGVGGVRLCQQRNPRNGDVDQLLLGSLEIVLLLGAHLTALCHI